jgi:hypothetical protein
MKEFNKDMESLKKKKDSERIPRWQLEGGSRK